MSKERKGSAFGLTRGSSSMRPSSAKLRVRQPKAKKAPSKKEAETKVVKSFQRKKPKTQRTPKPTLAEAAPAQPVQEPVQATSLAVSPLAPPTEAAAKVTSANVQDVTVAQEIQSSSSPADLEPEKGEEAPESQPAQVETLPAENASVEATQNEQVEAPVHASTHQEPAAPAIQEAEAIIQPGAQEIASEPEPEPEPEVEASAPPAVAPEIESEEETETNAAAPEAAAVHQALQELEPIDPKAALSLLKRELENGKCCICGRLYPRHEMFQTTRNNQRTFKCRDCLSNATE